MGGLRCFVGVKRRKVGLTGGGDGAVGSSVVFTAVDIGSVVRRVGVGRGGGTAAGVITGGGGGGGGAGGGVGGFTTSGVTTTGLATSTAVAGFVSSRARIERFVSDGRKTSVIVKGRNQRRL